MGRSVETDLFVAKLFSWQAPPQKESTPNWKGNIPTLEKYLASKNPYLTGAAQEGRDFRGSDKKWEKSSQSTDRRLVSSTKKEM